MEGNFSMKKIFLQVHSLLDLWSFEWSETHCDDTKQKSDICTVRKFVAPVPDLALIDNVIFSRML